MVEEGDTDIPGIQGKKKKCKSSREHIVNAETCTSNVGNPGNIF